MQENLINKLHEYITQNNPDVLLALQEKNSVTSYLVNKIRTIKDLIAQLQEAKKPEYIIEEVCMEELTKDLRPSKYNYIVNILEEDFAKPYNNLQQSGRLVYEVVNIIGYCDPVFESLKFSEEYEDNRQLRYAITGVISEYLNK